MFGPRWFVAGRSGVVLMWISVAFLCRGFGDVSLYNGSYYFDSVRVAEWSPFGKGLLTRLTICYLCILTVCGFS